jgi:hypothetical protein
MKKLLLTLTLALTFCSWAQSSPSTAAVPTLDELAGDWMQVDSLSSLPAVNNFAGGLQAARNLAAFELLTLPPYGQRGWAVEFKLDGTPVKAIESRWYPYEVRRRATVNEVVMESAIRMPFEQNGVLTRITLQNKSAQPRTLSLGLNVFGRVRIYPPEQWATWNTPRPNDGNFTATAAEGGKLLTIADQTTPALTAFAFVQPPDELKAEGELLTQTWMSAMSLQDPAAAHSDRPDHGPLGSYDGWPPMTMDGMCRFGAFDKATAFLRAVEPITHEGPFAQSHEFLGPEQRGQNPIVRTATRGSQNCNDGCGEAFAEVIIRSFFGIRPDLPGESLPLLLPKTPRGFNGELRHVPFHGALYSVKSDAQGIQTKKE